MLNPEVKILTENINLFYGDKQALFDVNIALEKNKVTALIGPSGCGKSSFLRCINRMNDTIKDCSITGRLYIDKRDIYNKSSRLWCNKSIFIM